MEQIWNIVNPADFVFALNEYIGEKCQHGDDLSKLSGPELVFYITQRLEQDVNSDGFAQFLFYAEEGCFTGVVQAFSEIGAVKTSEICEKALMAYGRELPADISDRQNVILELECDESDEILRECDDAFYEYVEDLNALNYEYVMRNKDAFT